MMNIAILGATGPIGSALASEFEKMKSISKLQLVARSYANRTEGKFRYKKANLLNAKETDDAIKGMDIVYITAGLKYKLSIWEHEWPLLIKNVIQASGKHKAKLVFFDNIYSYGLVRGPMTEETPLHPSSKKGQLRKQLEEMIIKEISNKKLTAVIAKSADYYGPAAKASLFYIQNIENLLQGKKPMWIGNPKMTHSFTYIPDAAKALVTLGMSSKANNQVWHIPTAKPLTGDTYMKLITKAMNKPFHYSAINKAMLRLFGIFNSQARELVEMFYQNDHDYVFDSSKFEKVFNARPTPYDNGIKQTVASFVNK